MINLSEKRREMDESGEYGVIIGGPLEILDDWDLNKHQTGKISDKSLIIYCYAVNMLRLNMPVNKKTVSEVTGWPEGAVVRCLNQLKSVGMLKDRQSSEE
jgi:hypothetical protein